VPGREELRALQGLLQPGDLAAGAGAGQPGQHLRVALAGDEVVHDVPAGDPVQVGDHARQLDRRRFQQLLGAALLPGALVGQVPPVAGVQPDQAELRGSDEAGGDAAALEADRRPARVRRVPLGPPGQVPHLPGVGQHALEPPGFQPAEHRLPVAARAFHHHGGHLPAAQPVRQPQHPPPGGGEAAGLLGAPRRVRLRRHPDRRVHLRLADADTAHLVAVQRLVGHLFHACLPSWTPAAGRRQPRGAARGTGGVRRN